MPLSRWTGLDLDNGVVRREVRSTQQTTIPISSRTVRHLREYVNKARPILDRDGERALFLNGHGKGITRQGVWLLLKSGS